MKSQPVSSQEINSIVESIRAGVNDLGGLRMAGHRAEAISAAIFDAGLVLPVDGRVTEVKAASATAVQRFDDFVSEAVNSNDPSMREFGKLLSQCTATDNWLTDDTEVDTPIEQPIFPEFNGLKLKNRERAELDQYLFYVGSFDDCHSAWQQLLELGIGSTCRRNGHTEKNTWCLILPLNAMGELREVA